MHRVRIGFKDSDMYPTGFGSDQLRAQQDSARSNLNPENSNPVGLVMIDSDGVHQKTAVNTITAFA
jgi:hypothetical protein